MSDTVLFESADGVATLTLNRPDRMNSLTDEIMTALPERLRQVAADPEVRCVVLTGAGDRAFSAGADLGNTGAGEESGTLSTQVTPEASVDNLQRHQEASLLLHTMRKPTLAAVNGAAAGASLSMVGACDIRVCSDTAIFTTAFQRIGFSGDFGGSYFWTHILGTAKTRELYLLGDRIDAETALQYGLVSRVFPQAEFRKQVGELARRIAAGPPIAYRYMKRNLNLVESGLGLEEILELEAEAMMRTARTEDFAKAAAAFLNKEEPEFHGR